MWPGTFVRVIGGCDEGQTGTVVGDVHGCVRVRLTSTGQIKMFFADMLRRETRGTA